LGVLSAAQAQPFGLSLYISDLLSLPYHFALWQSGIVQEKNILSPKWFLGEPISGNAISLLTGTGLQDQDFAGNLRQSAHRSRED